jgi:hypothetical protein
MRSTIALLIACCVASGCGSEDISAPSGPAPLQWEIKRLVEDYACDATTCRVTIAQQVDFASSHDRDMTLLNVTPIVTDKRTGRTVETVPAQLVGDDIRRLAGSNVVPAHKHLVVPLTITFGALPPIPSETQHNVRITIVSTPHPEIPWPR